MKIIEVNCETGEELIRDMTAQELADVNERKQKLEQEEADKQAKLAARQALLDKLGITAEEAKLLLS
jgi:phosphopantetheine adenylyltransferase